jgi:hypothetical protein
VVIGVLRSLGRTSEHLDLCRIHEPLAERRRVVGGLGRTSGNDSKPA